VTSIAFVESNMSGSGFQALRIAKDMGAEITFLTRDLSLYTSLPGVGSIFDRFVDEIVDCETNDSDAIVDVATRLGGRERFDALLAIGEYHLVQAAEAARQLDLPGVDPAAARLARNKWRCRERLETAGAPIPRYASVEDEEGARAAARELGFPCVVKPTDESGSIDVALSLDESDVSAQVRRILATPFNYRGQRRFPRIMVEEYVLGHEVSVETVTSAGETTVLGVTDKTLAGSPHFVEVGHTFPSALPAETVAVCEATARQALEAMGLDMGACHVELRLTADGPCLIEINGRLAGDRIPDLVELSTGIPIVREYLRMHLGLAPDLRPTRADGAAIRFLTGVPGTVRRIRGQELAQTMDGVTEVVLETAPGRHVGPLRDDHDRLGYVIATAETPYLAARRAEAAAHQVVFDIEPAVAA
jgi:S-sulfo-L-cysteine synthase (3-phospho-L-serine-dependent)